MSIQFSSNNLKYNNIRRPENKNIAFQGLNRHLSKHFVEAGISKITGNSITVQEAVREAIEANPKSRRFVGNLPAEWIKALPKENRKEHVQKIQDLFSGLAENLSTPKGTKFEKIENFCTDFSQQLKQILGLDTNIKDIGSGDIGKTYKLEIGKNKYVFKTFHSDVSSEVHGKILEPSRAPYANKKGCKSFIDFYFGKIATGDTKDGFMLTKFEDPKQQLIPAEELKRLIRILKSPVVSTDTFISMARNNSKNIIGEKIVDFGALNLVEQNLHESLKKAAKNINKHYFNSKKTPTNQDLAFKEIEIIKPSMSINLSDKEAFDNFIKNHAFNSNVYNLLQRLTAILKNST